MFYVIRRLGCPLCRKFAVELVSRRDEFDALGVRQVVIASVDIGAEMFALTAWKGGELYSTCRT